MRLQTSWSTHFSAFGSSNKANANMALFGNAIDAQKSKNGKDKQPNQRIRHHHIDQWLGRKD
jgi:hypothetical protein